MKYKKKDTFFTQGKRPIAEDTGEFGIIAKSYRKGIIVAKKFGGSIMKPSVSKIFEQKPGRWGLRGDPYLWDELQQAFTTIPLPCSETCFIHHFEQFFQELTNHPLKTESAFFRVEKYAHGGMSSGGISVEFWQKNALPLLITRLQKVNAKYI